MSLQFVQTLPDIALVPWTSDFTRKIPNTGHNQLVLTEKPELLECAEFQNFEHIITHNEKHHADEIFGACLLRRYFEYQGKDVLLLRISPEDCRLEELNSRYLLFDIGRGKYDHHPRSTCYHEPLNEGDPPIPYAAFGLLWRDFGKTICEHFAKDPQIASQLFKKVEEDFVISIDAIDNGIPLCETDGFVKVNFIPLSSILSILNNSKDRQNAFAEAFVLADYFFEEILKFFLSLITQNQQKISSMLPNALYAYFITRKFYPHIPFQESWATLPKEAKVEFYEKPFSQSEKKALPIAFFGKAWRSLGRQYCQSLTSDPRMAGYIYKEIQYTLIIGMDALAYNISLKPKAPYRFKAFFLSDIITMILQNSTSSTYQQSLEICLTIYEKLFERYVRLAVSDYETRNYLHSQVEKHNLKIIEDSADPHILVLDRFTHWKRWLKFESLKPMVVVQPGEINDYLVQIVPTGSDEPPRLFPKEWQGLPTNTLKELTGISTIKCIIMNGQLAIAEDLNGAIAIARLAIHP